MDSLLGLRSIGFPMLANLAKLESAHERSQAMKCIFETTNDADAERCKSASRSGRPITVASGYGLLEKSDRVFWPHTVGPIRPADRGKIGIDTD